MTYHKPDVISVLERIVANQERLASYKERMNGYTGGWGATARNIWMGSYDVWESKDDGPKYMKIMRDRMDQVLELGLIETESGDTNWHWSKDHWKLTDAGREFLNKDDECPTSSASPTPKS